MPRWSRRAAVVVVCLLVVGGGCGGEATEQHDAGVEVQADAAPTASLKVVVKEAGRESLLGPLPGVTVAFDRPDGTRVEQTTDAAGRTTFDGIDWSLGRGVLTTYLDGYAMSTIADLDATLIEPLLDNNGDLPVFMVSLTPAPIETITVTGSATGFVDPGANKLHLYPLRAYGTGYNYGNPANPFSFTIEPNKPFTLLGMEGLDGALPSNRGYFVTIARLMSLDVDPLTADPSTLNLDFAAHEVTPKRADGTITLPTRADSPMRSAWPNVWVMDWQTRGQAGCGWAEQIERAADGSTVTVSYIWTEPALIEAPHTLYMLTGPAKEYSYFYKEGYPVTGVLDPPMLDVPRWVTPANPAVPHPLGSPLQWEPFDDAPVVSFQIIRNNQVIWFVVARPNATSVTVPAPPSTVDRAAFLGPDALSATLLSGYTDDQNLFYKRFTVTRPIVINPQ